MNFSIRQAIWLISQSQEKQAKAKELGPFMVICLGDTANSV